MAPSSERLKKIVACRENAQLLTDAAALKEKEAAALKAIAATLSAWSMAAQQVEAIDRSIAEAKEELSSLRNRVLSLGDVARPALCDHISWPYGRGYQRILEKERRQLARRDLVTARADQKDRIKFLKIHIPSLEASRALVPNDYAAVRVLAVPQALERLPTLCRGRFRVQARKATLAVWRAMGKLDEEWQARGRAAECAELVDATKRFRGQAGDRRGLSPVAPALRDLPEAVLQQLATFGVACA